MNGWTGKILRVDLSERKVTCFSDQPYADQFLGGRGMASRLYWESILPETRAFDRENCLIFAVGPLVATGVQGARRLTVAGKSPMTYPEGYCFGNLGGFIGAEIKKAGFDGIVIQGQADNPVYLWIRDSEVEIRPASQLWGLNALQTEEMLRRVHGDKARVITTGVAGERKVRTAIIYASRQATATGGFGAVMGSKNLKAIAVLGSGKPLVAENETLRELNRYTSRICTPLTLVAPPLVNATGHADLVEVIGKDSCYQCGIKCNRQLYRYARKLEGPRHCQSMEYYLPWRYGKGNEPVETFFTAPALANDYSLDTFELQSVVDWLYACYNSGTLTEDETGLPLSKIGTREFLEKLLHNIAYREGFGDLLAEGLVRASEKVSDQARARIGYEVAPVCQHDLAPPRAIVAHALIYPLEPRVHQAIIHETLFIQVAWLLNQRRPEISPVI
jgi:aldehyde:ferredoxin oxidoreductase